MPHYLPAADNNERSVEGENELAERKRLLNDVFGAVCMSAGFGEHNTAEAKQREG